MPKLCGYSAVTGAYMQGIVVIEQNSNLVQWIPPEGDSNSRSIYTSPSPFNTKNKKKALPQRAVLSIQNAALPRQNTTVASKMSISV